MTTPQETEDIKGMRTYLVCENPPHYLTPANDSDVSEIVRVLSINKDVYYGTATFQFPFLESHALKRLEMVNRYRESLKFNSHFAVRTSPTGPLIGWSSSTFQKMAPKSIQIQVDRSRLLSWDTGSALSTPVKVSPPDLSSLF